MRVLVTGAQGYLGARLLNALAARPNVEAVGSGRRAAETARGAFIQADLLDGEDVRRLLAEAVPDRIVHCAAFVPDRMEDYADARAAAQSLAMIEHLLAASAPPALLYVSSMTVYGQGADGPTPEDAAGDPTSAYGLGKWRGERLIADSGRQALAARIPGLFGPPRMGGLVANALRAFKHGETPRLPDAPFLWSAMHVADAAALLADLASAPWPHNGFEAVNVGYAGRLSVDGFVAAAAALYGREADYRLGHPAFEYDLSRLAGFGLAPPRGLEAALADFGDAL